MTSGRWDLSGISGALPIGLPRGQAPRASYPIRPDHDRSRRRVGLGIPATATATALRATRVVAALKPRGPVIFSLVAIPATEADGVVQTTGTTFHSSIPPQAFQLELSSEKVLKIDSDAASRSCCTSMGTRGLCTTACDRRSKGTSLGGERSHYRPRTISIIQESRHRGPPQLNAGACQATRSVAGDVGRPRCRLRHTPRDGAPEPRRQGRPHREPDRSRCAADEGPPELLPYQRN